VNRTVEGQQEDRNQGLFPLLAVGYDHISSPVCVMSGNDQPARNFMLGVHELIVAGYINPVKRSTLSPTCIFSKMPMLDRIFLARRDQYRGPESNTSLLARNERR
jgi:hypothetical protein